MSTNPLHPILVVDDELETLKSIELLLLSFGISNILLCNQSSQVPDILQKNRISIALIDLMMPDLSGEGILEIMQTGFPEVPVIIITGANDIDTAVRCMKKGAYDFFLKPVDKEVFEVAVKRALEKSTLTREINNLKNHMLKKKLEHPEAFQNIITNNKGIYTIFSYLEAVSPGPEPVLITGENGTGKELFAKAIHALSKRQGEFVAVNVAGLDDTLFSDTLFGHKKGAFSDASTQRKGLVEKAFQGTLFLDEIGDLSIQSQIKLLRLLQENEFYPLGADLAQQADTRVVVATNRDLGRLIEKQQFRRDLFYRLNTHSIDIPPLRERMDDIPLLLDFFLKQAEAIYKRADVTYSNDFLDLLMTYSFPGNIRELRALVFDCICLTSNNTLAADVLKSKLDPKAQKNIPKLQLKPDISFPGKLPTLKQTADMVVEEALRRTGGNQSKAASLLGITHQALSKRLKSQDKKQQR
jgi:DNA-binding NtrC family response regulator